jgi:hypothetical protein
MTALLISALTVHSKNATPSSNWERRPRLSRSIVGWPASVYAEVSSFPPALRHPHCREGKKPRNLIEARRSLQVPEIDPAINTGMRKGSQYGLTWGMVDFKGRTLNVL